MAARVCRVLNSASVDNVHSGSSLRYFCSMSSATMQSHCLQVAVCTNCDLYIELDGIS